MASTKAKLNFIFKGQVQKHLISSCVQNYQTSLQLLRYRVVADEQQFFFSQTHAKFAYNARYVCIIIGKKLKNKIYLRISLFFERFTLNNI